MIFCVSRSYSRAHERTLTQRKCPAPLDMCGQNCLLLANWHSHCSHLFRKKRLMLEGLRPPDLIQTAKDLVAASNGRPRQTNLRRAVSTVYYALFHCLAQCCADSMIGGAGATRSRSAWIQVYRALDHGQVKHCCRQKPRVLELFPKEIQDFANAFATLQEKRHAADYDPAEKFYKSDVEIHIQIAESVIEGFKSAPLKDRRAFAALVLFKSR